MEYLKQKKIYANPSWESMKYSASLDILRGQMASFQMNLTSPILVVPPSKLEFQF